MDEKIFVFKSNAEKPSLGNDFCNTPLKELPLTMVYAPMQAADSQYSEKEALAAGTLFPSLDKPFLGRKAR